ncbi:glycosyl transferase family 1 [Novosphingobium sp. 11B]
MELDQTVRASVAYLVHDMDDTAVRRRVDLLLGEGLAVALGGFHRRASVMDTDIAHRVLDLRRTVDLGRTMDARLMQRAAAVARHLLDPAAVRELCYGASVIVARNLEMLVLAWRVRRREQRLVYECLDIHRLMLGGGWKSRMLRWLERWLLARTDLVIVSSPAFADRYFSKRQRRSEGVILVENKVSRLRSGVPPLPRSSSDAPIVIGWFGMLRCRRTFTHLAQLAQRARGRVEVVIAGIASPAEFPDFEAEVSKIPRMRYLGAYRLEDLADLYTGVDFVWAIDYFEEGMNSEWLLPNRLYEGLAHGAIPIALKSVETGRWLARRDVGLLLDDADSELPDRLLGLTADERWRMQVAIAALPDSALHQALSERRAIAEAILGRARA